VPPEASGPSELLEPAEWAARANLIWAKGQDMEYKVLSGPFDAATLGSDLKSHAAEKWRVAGTFQAFIWVKSRTPTVILLERAGA
jgi:hypothetical protein